MQGARTFELLLSWAVSTALLFVVVIVDERRMSEERLERAWPPASRDAAIVAFGILALPLHFVRTRGSYRSVRGVLGKLGGLVLGVVALVVVTVINAAVITAYDMLVGLPLD